MDYDVNNLAGCIAFHRVVGCSECSLFFAEPENFIGMCHDTLEDPFRIGINIFRTVENVRRANSSVVSAWASVNGFPILIMILSPWSADDNLDINNDSDLHIITADDNLDINNGSDLHIITLAPVACSECDTICGWEMVAFQNLPDYPKLKTGQFIIDGSLIDEARVRRIKKRRI